MLKNLFCEISDALPDNTEHWCAECDNNIVKSNDKTTGMFFCISGSEWLMPKTLSFVNFNHKTMRGIGVSKQVIIALCPECLKNLK